MAEMKTFAFLLYVAKVTGGFADLDFFNSNITL